MSVNTTLILFASSRVPSLFAAENEQACEEILRLCECDKRRDAHISEPCTEPMNRDDLAFSFKPIAAVPQALREKRVVRFSPPIGPLFHELARAIDVPLISHNTGGYSSTNLILGRHIQTFEWREEIDDPGRRFIETDVAFSLFGYGTPEYKRYLEAAERSDVLNGIRDRLATIIGPVDIELDMSW